MKTLARRAVRVYREEGIRAVTAKSIHYTARSVVHALGSNGFYQSDRFLALLQWMNAGYCRYDALADAFTIIWVNPSEIKRVTGRGPNPGHFQWQDIGTIAGGDWDRSDEWVDDLPVVRALQQRFEEGRSWDEIKFLDHVRREAARGNPRWRGCTSLEDVDRECERVDILYDRIRTEDYRTKRDLLQSGDIEPRNDPAGRFQPYDEVVVDVGRDGEFLFVDGRHRLAIAKILELEEIPVRISARHVEWQRIRERVADADDPVEVPDSISQHLDHPDLADLLADSE